MTQHPFYEKASQEYDKCKTHGDLIEWVRRALEAEATIAAKDARIAELEAALKEIDELLTGTLPVTKQVKAIARKVLK